MEIVIPNLALEAFPPKPSAWPPPTPPPPPPQHLGPYATPRPCLHSRRGVALADWSLSDNFPGTLLWAPCQWEIQGKSSTFLGQASKWRHIGCMEVNEPCFAHISVGYPEEMGMKLAFQMSGRTGPCFGPVLPMPKKDKIYKRDTFRNPGITLDEPKGQLGNPHCPRPISEKGS